MEEHKHNQPKDARYRESDSSDDRFGEKKVHQDPLQDDQFRNDYNPTYEDQYRARRNRWSEDIRSIASRENYSGKGPKGYKRSIDKIKDEACEILARDFELDASNIEVEIKENFLFLKGFVFSRQDKKKAESLVEDISGIDDVQNQLQIKKNSVEGWIPGIGSIEDET